MVIVVVVFFSIIDFNSARELTEFGKFKTWSCQPKKGFVMSNESINWSTNVQWTLLATINRCQHSSNQFTKKRRVIASDNIYQKEKKHKRINTHITKVQTTDKMDSSSSPPDSSLIEEKPLIIGMSSNFYFYIYISFISKCGLYTKLFATRCTDHVRLLSVDPYQDFIHWNVIHIPYEEIVTRLL